MLSRTIISLFRSTEGSAIVESAVVLPMLFSLVLGVYEFSWFYYKQQLVETGVRDAARYLARSSAGASDANPCNNATAVANAKYIATNTNYSATNGAISGGTARVPTWTTAAVTITCPAIDNSSGSYVGGTTLHLVTVSTSFADPALGFFGFLKLPTPNISASHSERSIGPG